MIKKFENYQATNEDFTDGNQYANLMTDLDRIINAVAKFETVVEQLQNTRDPEAQKMAKHLEGKLSKVLKGDLGNLQDVLIEISKDFEDFNY